MPPEEQELFESEEAAGPEVEDFPVVGGGPPATRAPDEEGSSPDGLEELYERSYRHIYQLLKSIWGDRVTPHEVHEATATLFIAQTNVH